MQRSSEVRAVTAARFYPETLWIGCSHGLWCVCGRSKESGLVGLCLEVILVQPALRLVLTPRPSPGALPGVPLSALRRAVPVSHAPVSLLQQPVVRDLVRLHIPVHEFKRPRKERVDLQQSRLVHLERL
jgi:hypothetical protein